jgi:hypothetical protein
VFYDLARIVRNSFEFILKNKWFDSKLAKVLDTSPRVARFVGLATSRFRFSIPGSRFRVLDSGFLISGSKFSTLGYKRKSPERAREICKPYVLDVT